MFFKDIYKPMISDFDRKGKLSYEAILHILENAGSNHSNLVNDNVVEGSQEGIAWILVDWRLDIISRSVSNEDIQVVTWVRGKAPSATVFRDYILTDKNGKELVRAESKFALLYIENGRLARISKELFESYAPEDKQVFNSKPSKLVELKEYIAEKYIAVRRSDIDFNGHVHNTRYIDFFMESLPADVYQKYESADCLKIHIVYSKPIIENDIVTGKYNVIADDLSDCEKYSHCVNLYSGDKLCALIKLV